MLKEQKIAADIAKVLVEHKATSKDGNIALFSVLITSLIQDGVPKEAAVRAFGLMWDQVEPSFDKFKKERDLQ